MESFLIVRIGSNKLGIKVKDIHFIVRNNGIVPLPDMPEWMEGVISYRDKVVPVLNNKERLNLKNSNENNKRIVLCTPKKDTLIGINVDQSIGIFKVEQDNVKKSKNKGALDSTINLKKEIIPVLNMEKLLTGEQIEFIKKL